MKTFTNCKEHDHQALKNKALTSSLIDMLDYLSLITKQAYQVQIKAMCASPQALEYMRSFNFYLELESACITSLEQSSMGLSGINPNELTAILEPRLAIAQALNKCYELENSPDSISLNALVCDNQLFFFVRFTKSNDANQSISPKEIEQALKTLSALKSKCSYRLNDFVYEQYRKGRNNER